MRLPIWRSCANRAARRWRRRVERRRRASGADDRREPRDAAPNAALNALVAGALALPGFARVATASGPVDEATGAVSYYRYLEDDLRPSRFYPQQNSTRERMEVGTLLFQIVAPVGDRTDVEVDGSAETMSGASPWYVFQADPTQQPLQVMSGATIDDQRGDLLVTGNRYFDWGKASASAGTSIENDFYSLDLGLGAERDFNDRNTTLSTGVDVSLNWIEPTQDRSDPTRIDSADRQNVAVRAGLSQVLTRHSIFQTTFGFEYSTGYLSDPYKRAQVGYGAASNIVRDHRPDERKQYVWLNRYRHHFSRFDGSLHLDYQLYLDDWSVASHTFDVAYYQSLPWGLEIIPSFRYYSQSQAGFYEPVYAQQKANGHYSSDYRLSPYGAIAYRLTAQWAFEDPWWNVDWIASLGYERYESNAKWALQHVSQSNPGLVRFRIFSAGLTARF